MVDYVVERIASVLLSTLSFYVFFVFLFGCVLVDCLLAGLKKISWPSRLRYRVASVAVVVCLTVVVVVGDSVLLTVSGRHFLEFCNINILCDYLKNMCCSVHVRDILFSV